MKRNVFQDGNGSGLVMIEGLGEYAPIAMVAELKFKIERLKAQSKNLYQEAVIHAQEARTQRSTVHDIYQALGIQEGDWNGKKPVVEKFAAVEHERDQLKVVLHGAVDELVERISAATQLIQCEDGAGSFVSAGAINNAVSHLRISINDPVNHLATHDAEVVWPIHQKLLAAQRATSDIAQAVLVDEAAEMCLRLSQQAKEVQS